MSSVSFKQALFAQFARTGQALANGNRLQLLEFLAQGERNVDSLSRVSGLTVANTSRHLQQLKQAGLVTTRRDGIHVYYRLSGEDVLVLLNALRAVSESHLAEVDRLVTSYLTAKDELEPLPREELLARARMGSVTVLDVRPAEEYAAGRLPGSVNVPVADLEQRLSEFDPKQEIVAYCRGPYCVLAFEAVAQLRKHGFRARRLEEGFPEWKSAGLPVEQG